MNHYDCKDLCVINKYNTFALTAANNLTQDTNISKWPNTSLPQANYFWANMVFLYNPFNLHVSI